MSTAWPEALWSDVVGQPKAVGELQRAAEAAHRTGATRAAAMTHAWLLTGPPGSGRSTAARSFAAALLTDPAGGPDATQDAARVFAGTHPDLTVVATDKALISIDEVRALVSEAQRAPSGGRFRIILIEDADRMTERTCNVLLKAIEEPPERTVWLLCAPSPSDVVPTIRSRCRVVGLRVPSATDVQELLHRKHGVEPDVALWAAAASQNHIGRARYLASNETARAQRTAILSIPERLGTVGDAVRAAGRIVEEAADAAKAATEDRAARERAELLQTLGVEAGKAVPPALRAQIRQLEEDQKRRATRARQDELDRVLLDLLSLYRDVLLVQLGAGGSEINRGAERQITAMAQRSSAALTLQRVEAITEARRRLQTNTAPLLVLEALFLQLRD